MPGIFVMNFHRIRWTKKDREFMQSALKLAAKGRGKTSPNPMVGALVVKNGQVLAKGYHRKFGGPHAEAIAIKACSKEARGATLYTTLEPCCHFGKTPPCTELIIQSGVKKVVCAAIDPNPRVNGKGLKLLAKNGIRVSLGLLEDQARKLNEVHFKYMTTGLPFVVLRVAQSLDGIVLQEERSSHDKPKKSFLGSLTSMDQVIDAVLCEADASKDHPAAALLGSAYSGKTKLMLLGTGRQIGRTVRALPEEIRQRTVAVPTDNGTGKAQTPTGVVKWKVRRYGNGRVDLFSLLKKAGKEGISGLLVNGGIELSTGLLKRNLVDKIWYLISPDILFRGEEPFGDLGSKKISRCKIVKQCEFHRSPQGILAVGYTNSPDKHNHTG